jgi:hypothetical protein
MQILYSVYKNDSKDDGILTVRVRYRIGIYFVRSESDKVCPEWSDPNPVYYGLDQHHCKETVPYVMYLLRAQGCILLILISITRTTRIDDSIFLSQLSTKTSDYEGGDRNYLFHKKQKKI